jgi:hypothetical protein
VNDELGTVWKQNILTDSGPSILPAAVAFLMQSYNHFICN